MQRLLEFGDLWGLHTLCHPLILCSSKQAFGTTLHRPQHAACHTPPNFSPPSPRTRRQQAAAQWLQVGLSRHHARIDIVAERAAARAADAVRCAVSSTRPLRLFLPRSLFDTHAHTQTHTAISTTTTSKHPITHDGGPPALASFSVRQRLSWLWSIAAFLHASFSVT
eukprot:5104508-Pleurochrysis_carterae.AAC.5